MEPKKTRLEDLPPITPLKKKVGKEQLKKKLEIKKFAIVKQTKEKKQVKAFELFRRKEKKPVEKEKKKSRGTKDKLKILIIVVLLGIIIFIGISIYFYFKTPEKTLGIGANIESALLSPDFQDAYVKLLGGSDKNITKVKFIFTDFLGEEHYYETTEGAVEISVAFERSFWDWLFRKPKFKGKYEYRINAEDVGLFNFEDIEEVSVLFEYEEEGITVETGVLDTKQTTTKTTTTGGGNGGNGEDGGGTCTTGSWTNIEEYRCNKTIKERKQARSICPSGTEEQWIVENCPANYTCYAGAGAPADKCINETKICVDSDELDYYNQGNVTLDLLNFVFDECSITDDNVTEYYCYFNGTEFEIRNESFNCSGGCVGGACEIPECTHNDNCTVLNLNEIARCSNSFFEYAPANNSECTGGFCTIPTQTIISSCNISCGAECETSSNCLATECDNLDGCQGNDYYDYNDIGNNCLSNCNCESNSCDDYTVSYNDARCIGFCMGITECGNYTDEENCTTDICDAGICKWNATFESCYNYEENVYYVSQLDPNCDDGGNGTSEVPWCNLNRSYTWYSGVGPKVQEGDTVIFRDGEYGEFIENAYPYTERYVERDDWVTYKADTGASVNLSSIYIDNRHPNYDVNKIKGKSRLIFDGLNIVKGNINLKHASYIQFLNCDFEGPYITFPESKDWYIYQNHLMIRANSVDNVIVDNCNFHHFQIGVHTISESRDKIHGDNWTIRNSNFGPIGGIGVYTYADNIEIINNSFYDWSSARAEYWLNTTPEGVTGFFEEYEPMTQEVTGATARFSRVDGNRVYIYRTSNIDFADGHLVTGDITGANFIVNNYWVGKTHGNCIYVLDGNNINILNNNIACDRVNPSHAPGQYAISVAGVDSVTPISNLTIANNVLYGSKTGDGILKIYGTTSSDVINNTVRGGEFAGFPDYTGIRIVPGDRYKVNTIIDNLYNNIGRLELSGDSGGYYARIINHGNNIFSNNPNGMGGSYLFTVEDSELINYPLDNLFAGPGLFHENPLNFDFHPLMSSPACNGSVNPLGVAVGALPCVCIDNSQCQEVFGSEYICQNGECKVFESTEYHAIVSDASASPGATSVPVPVYLNNIGSREIIGIDITLNYDSDLITAVDVQKGSLTQNWNLEKNTSITNQVKIALYNSTKLANGGEIARIIFDVNSSAPDGSTAALTLTEFEANEIPVTNIINGIFSIQSEGELSNLASILSAIQGIINKAQSIIYGIIK